MPLVSRLYGLTMLLCSVNSIVSVHAVWLCSLLYSVTVSPWSVASAGGKAAHSRQVSIMICKWWM